MIGDAAGAADVLRGIASLLWPLLALAAILIFRGELRQLLRRVRHWKGFGQEVELDRTLDNLQRTAANAESQLPAQPVFVEPPAGGRGAGVLAAPAEPPSVVPVARGIEEASPDVALMLLGRDLEVELRNLVASMGFLARVPRRPSVLGYVETLQAAGFVSRELSDAIRDFWRVRNRIVHGKKAPEHTVVRALDIGIGLLNAIRTIPHERNFVYHPGVPVFSDGEGASRREGVLGVVLRTVSSEGPETRRVFPTTKTDYVVGQRVAWEWDDGRVWGESWYRDPDTDELAYAWTSSVEFIGRPLEEID